MEKVPAGAGSSLRVTGWSEQEQGEELTAMLSCSDSDCTKGERLLLIRSMIAFCSPGGSPALRGTGGKRSVERRLFSISTVPKHSDWDTRRELVGRV